MTTHSYAEEANESSRLHPDVEALRDQLTALIKSQGDEARSCHKVLTDQIISFDVRLRSIEKDSGSGPRLDMYQTQVDFEHKLLRHQQELKNMIGDVVRTEELKASEETVKRANNLRIQTLEYRLKEMADSQEEIRTVLQSLLKKDRSKEPAGTFNPENIANQVYATSVQRIDKLLERELVPLLNEQEQRLAAGIERRFAMGKEEQRTSTRGENELLQRVNMLDESFKTLETSMLRSQSLAPESRRSTEDLKMLEKMLNQGLNQTKLDWKNDISRLESDFAALNSKVEGLPNTLKGELAQQGFLLEGQIKAQCAVIGVQAHAELQPLQQAIAQMRTNNSQTKQEVELLRSDYAAFLQQLAALEGRTKELETWVSSAQERSDDALNQSIVIDKSGDASDKSPDGLATFGEMEVVGKVVQKGRMKGGIRGIQQLHLTESSPEESSRSVTPGLTAEQITADIFEGLLETEMEHCMSLLKPQEFVLSSLDSYRDMGRAAVSPLLSWDPDEEQDEGANLSDRRVDVRRFG
jgi:hypothetical protein